MRAQGAAGTGAGRGGEKCGCSPGWSAPILDAIALSFQALAAEMFPRDWEGPRVISPGHRGCHHDLFMTLVRPLPSYLDLVVPAGFSVKGCPGRGWFPA